ncbi:MAG: hypothetical protein GDA42_12680 [Ekhidna sp.]|nr:hypothetical protein [Ekhidna sp.]MBC6411282.1 hypothetical protein [Ekhidna sp.]
MKLKYIPALLIGLFFTASCGNSSSSAEKSNVEKKEEIKDFIEKEFTYPLPTSFEVSRMLENASTSYSAKVVNNPEKVDAYVATWQKAANLGVYGADLSYAATFEKTQETLDFLEVSKKLIDDLNITSAFNASMAERIENNLENIDSLIFIVTESFYDTYNYLNQNGEEKTSILVIAGSVIEGLYITSELVKQSENKSELMGVLGNQKIQVAKLIELMEQHQEDEDVNKILPNLRYIQLVYDQLGEEAEMTEGQFSDISNGVTDMRNLIVE